MKNTNSKSTQGSTCFYYLASPATQYESHYTTIKKKVSHSDRPLAKFQIFFFLLLLVPILNISAETPVVPLVIYVIFLGISFTWIIKNLHTKSHVSMKGKTICVTHGVGKFSRRLCFNTEDIATVNVKKKETRVKSREFSLEFKNINGKRMNIDTSRIGIEELRGVVERLLSSKTSGKLFV